MSVQAISAVLEHSEARGSARVVMFVLADHADEYGFCWPGGNRIAHRSRIAKRNVQHHFRELEAMGELRRCKRRGKSNVFQILLPGLRMVDGEQEKKLLEWGVEIVTGDEIVIATESSPKPKALSIREVVSKSRDAFCQICGTELNRGGYCEAGCEVAL